MANHECVVPKYSRINKNSKTVFAFFAHQRRSLIVMIASMFFGIVLNTILFHLTLYQKSEETKAAEAAVKKNETHVRTQHTFNQMIVR